MRRSATAAGKEVYEKVEDDKAKQEWLSRDHCAAAAKNVLIILSPQF